MGGGKVWVLGIFFRDLKGLIRGWETCKELGNAVKNILTYIIHAPKNIPLCWHPGGYRLFLNLEAWNAISNIIFQYFQFRFLMDRMNLDGRGTSIMVSPREGDKIRPKSAGYPLKSTANTAVETDLPDYSDDDFCSDEESSPRESARTPRLSWVENKESDMIDTCTQTVVHSGLFLLAFLFCGTQILPTTLWKWHWTTSRSLPTASQQVLITSQEWPTPENFHSYPESGIWLHWLISSDSYLFLTLFASFFSNTNEIPRIQWRTRGQRIPCPF